MTRAWLRDDPPWAVPVDDGKVGRVVVALDGEAGLAHVPYEIPIVGWPTPPGVPGGPGGGGGVVDAPEQRTVVRARQRSGFDVDGNPVFEWVTVLDGPGKWSTIRREFDAMSGLVAVTATVMLEFDGDERVFETALVQRVPDGTVWRVVAVKHPYGRVELSLRMIDQEADAATGEAPAQLEFVVQPDGSRLYSGLGPPPSSIAGIRDDDWYFDVENQLLYKWSTS